MTVTVNVNVNKFCGVMILIWLIGSAVSAKAQTNDPALETKNPALWIKNYKDLNVVVNVSDITQHGITKGDIQTEVESRLRQADIRPRTDVLPSGGPITPADGPLLEVDLTNTDESALIEIKFLQGAFWTLPNGGTINVLVPTWWDAKTAYRVRGKKKKEKSRAFVLAGIDGSLDKFVNAYLKANQAEGVPTQVPTAGQQPVDNPLSRATATLSGKITFEGAPPPNSRVQMSTDPYCQMHSADYQTLETVKVSDGGLENVIIFVSSGLPLGVTYTAPTTPIELEQLNCHYIPHVLTMMTQQRLSLRNSDATLHNIHVWSEKNPQFNVGQPVMNMVNATTFANPEMPLVIRDDVHRWESAFVGVFDHPFHTVSKSGGLFELKLPPGYYEITAWHEKYPQKTMMVGVMDNERRVINITFAPDDK